MKENKNQMKKPAGTGLSAKVTTGTGTKSVLVKAYPVVDPRNPYRILDDNHKLVRRHSFDDNGGGYQGL